ncbi:hypothetical protein HK405_012864, partial [Cladochytrium tenue]
SAARLKLAASPSSSSAAPRGSVKGKRPDLKKTPFSSRRAGGEVPYAAPRPAAGARANKFAGAVNKVVATTATLLGFLVGANPRPRRSITAGASGPRPSDVSTPGGIFRAAGVTARPSTPAGTGGSGGSSGGSSGSSSGGSAGPRAGKAPFASRPASRMAKDAPSASVTGKQPAAPAKRRPALFSSAMRPSTPSAGPHDSRRAAAARPVTPAPSAASAARHATATALRPATPSPPFHTRSAFSTAAATAAHPSSSSPARPSTPSGHPTATANVAVHQPHHATSHALPHASGGSNSAASGRVSPTPPPRPASAASARSSRAVEPAAARPAAVGAKPASAAAVPTRDSPTPRSRTPALRRVASNAALAAAARRASPTPAAAAATAPRPPPPDVLIDPFGFLLLASAPSAGPRSPAPSQLQPDLSRVVPSPAARRAATADARRLSRWLALASTQPVTAATAAAATAVAESPTAGPAGPEVAGVPLRVRSSGPVFGFPHHADRFRAAVARDAGGVPQVWRGHVWYHLITAQSGLLAAPSTGEDGSAATPAVSLGRGDGPLDVRLELRSTPSRHEAHFKRDIERAFPNHVLYFGEGSQGRSSLLSLLRAFTMGKLSFGYWRGLSKIAGLLLLMMEEE